ncbi:MAG: hypothetical protein IPN09_08020 [Bacteroidetes bacterium]|nr:hypothetical protein [Bacteroidota bacterium]
MKPTIALKAGVSRAELEGQLVMITPNSMGTAVRKPRPFATASSSGWMMLQKRNFGGEWIRICIVGPCIGKDFCGQ